MSENGEEEYRDEVQERINQVFKRIQNIRKPFRERRRRLVDAILGSLERRSLERRRPYRYSNPSFEEEDEISEIAKLKKEIQDLRQQLEQSQKRPKPTVAIKTD